MKKHQMTEEVLWDPKDILSSLPDEYVVSCDDFDMKRLLGTGTYGDVFCAIHRETGRQVAVKRLKVELRDNKNICNFCREVTILANCKNYFLLSFLGFSPVPPFAIVTDYITRGSLFEALRHKPESPRLTPANKLLIVFGIARGMLYLHQHRFIHRDLKSLNILLDDEVLPRVCDFGIARFLEENSDGCMTQQVGTPHWMAPESFEGSSYTNKVDVYAFGVIVWEILTEMIPWQGVQVYQLIKQVQGGHRPRIPLNCPSGLKELINLCWDSDPDRRPTFAQVCLLLAQKAVFFPGGTADCIDKFLTDYPFSEGEIEEMSKVADSAEWVLEKYGVKPGEKSKVEVTPIPLGGDGNADRCKRHMAQLASQPSQVEAQSDEDTSGEQPDFIVDQDGYSYHSSSSTHSQSEAPMEKLPPAPKPLDDAAVKRPGPVSFAGRPENHVPVARAPMSHAGVPHSDENIFLKDRKLQELLEKVQIVPYDQIRKDQRTEDSKNIFVQVSQVAKPVSDAAWFRKQVKEVHSPPESVKFFNATLEKITSSRVGRISITRKISYFLKRNPAVVPYFLQTDWLSSLELDRHVLFDANLRILVACMAHDPNVVTPEIMARLLNDKGDKASEDSWLTPARADRIVYMFSLLINAVPQRKDVNEMVKLLLDSHSRLLSTDRYVDSVFMIATSQQFQAFRKDCLSVFSAGLHSSNPSVVRKCFHAICSLNVSVGEIPMHERVESLKDPSQRQWITQNLELIVRLDKIPVSKRLVDALITVGTESPLTMYCCCKLAEKKEGAELFVQNDAWMVADQFAVSDAVNLFLMICQNKEVRPHLLTCNEFPHFLARVVKSSTDEEINAITVTLRRLEVAADVVKKLDTAGFFNTLVTDGLETGSERKKECSLLLIDHCARIAWVNGYSTFINHLPHIFAKKGGFAQRAVVPAVVLATFPEGKKCFEATDVVNVLESCPMGGDYGKYRTKLLDLLRA